MLLDAHCHIDQYRDPSSVAEACERMGLLIVAVTSLPSHYKIGIQHVGRLRHVKLALGFHPLVAAKHSHELNEFLRLAPNVMFIGEIGLDFSREGLASKSRQLTAFRTICEALAGSGKFISLHSRGAEETVLDVLQEFKVEQAVFHWYSGSVNILNRAIDGGHYFSVNPAMVRSIKGRQILATIPRERMLTETDGPYVRIGTRPAEPSDVSRVVEFLGEAWGVTAEEASAQVLRNYRQIVTQP